MKKLRKAVWILGAAALILIVAAALLGYDRYRHSILVAKEFVLRDNLQVTRGRIDLYFSDKGCYPPSLAALVEEAYLHRIPTDPITMDADWTLVPIACGDDGHATCVQSIASSAPTVALDGSRYADW